MTAVAAPAPARAVAKLASFEMRAIALVLDLVILFICIALFFAAAGLVLLLSTDFGENDASDTAFNAFLYIWASSLFVWALIEILPTAFMGQTIGKLIMGLKVVRRSGRPPGFWRAVLRFLGYLVTPMLIGVAFFTGLFSDERLRLAVVGGGLVILIFSFGMVFVTRGRRAFHDIVAGTYVIEARQYRPTD